MYAARVGRTVAVMLLLASCGGPPTVDAGTDAPLDAPIAPAVCAPDRDGDGIPDDTEQVAPPDPDRDGMANDVDLDSDGDGLSDHDESMPIRLGEPCRWAPACLCTAPHAYDADADRDGLSDPAEATAGTDACDPDTDADGCPDGAACGEVLDAAFFEPLATSVSVHVRYVTPGSATLADVRLGVTTPTGLAVGTVTAAATTAGTVAGDHFTGVPGGATVEFDVTLESVSTDQLALDAETQLLGDGVVQLRRPLRVFIPCAAIPI